MYIAHEKKNKKKNLTLTLSAIVCSSFRFTLSSGWYLILNLLKLQC